MKKADWLILICVMVFSYTLLYFFKTSEQPKPQVTPPQEVVQPVVVPEVKPPEITKPEVTKPEFPCIIVFDTRFGKVTFKHGAHAEGCWNCHHEVTGNDSMPIACSNCHEKRFWIVHSKNNIRGCIGCHKNIGVEPGFKDCFVCHER